MSRKPLVLALTGGLMSDAPPPLSSLSDDATVITASTPAELEAAIPEADILLVWDYRYAAIEPLIHRAPRLSWVHAAAVGVDPLLTPSLRSSDIVLTNSRGVFDTPIAEYVLGLLLQRLKRFEETAQLRSRREWGHRITHMLAGQTVAVVGTGSIGRRIARMLRTNDVNVILVGRTARENDAEFGRVRSTSDLVDVVRVSDALVLAAPLTEESRFMVDRKVLDALGPAGYLVNVGRGALVSEGALVEALVAGTLGGAALDVFMQEPLPADSLFWDMANVFVSPHMSADYAGFEEDLIALFTENLQRWKAGEPLANVVDKTLGYVPSNR